MAKSFVASHILSVVVQSRCVLHGTVDNIMCSHFIRDNARALVNQRLRLCRVSAACASASIRHVLHLPLTTKLKPYLFDKWVQNTNQKCYNEHQHNFLIATLCTIALSVTYQELCQ